MRNLRCGRLAAAVVALLAVCGATWAQTPASLILTYEFADVPLKKPRAILPSSAFKAPEIDGDLNKDGCWGGCTPSELGSDMPDGTPTRRTSVRVCYDDDALYLGLVCREPAIGDVPLLMGKKPLKDYWSDENVQFWLAFSAADNDFFLFSVDPNGSTYTRSAREGVKWNPEWQVKTVRMPDGWNAEIAIPFKSLNGHRPGPNESWRANFCRDIAATGERCSWEPTLGNRQNPATWGVLFFGSYTAYTTQPQPARLAIFPDQWTLRAEDKTLRAVVRIEPGTIDLSRCRLRVGINPDAKGAPGTPAPAVLSIKGVRVNLVLNVANLAPGDLTLVAELIDNDNATVGQAEVTLRKDATPAAPAPGKLTLQVPPCPVKGAAASSWPISTGVALPRGALHRPDHVRLLNSAGKEVPCRGQVRSRWPADGSIRWLALDFRTDLSVPGGERFTLEYGPQVNPVVVRGFNRRIEALKFEVGQDAWILETEDAWWINTGALLFAVGKRYSGIKQAFVDVDANGHFDWTEQILSSETSGAGPYITDSAGRVYLISEDPNVRVDLEEWNELRLVLRVEGRLVPADRTLTTRDALASSMGRCILRITAYAGQPSLGLQCTFFFNDRAAHTVIGDMGILERLDFKRFDSLFGTPTPFRQPIRDTGPVFLMKLQPDQFLVQNAKEPPTVNLGGTEAPNWAAAAVADRGIMAALRDMAELHPKAIEFCPEVPGNSKSKLVVHFWPPFGADTLRSLKGDINRRTVGEIAFATAGKLLDLSVPATFAGGLKDRDGLPDFDAVRAMDLADPTGIAPTYDVFYSFYRGAVDPAEVASVSRLFEAHPHAVQDPQSLAASGVLPELLPSPRAERASAMLQRLLKLEARTPGAGEFNFMDVHRTWLAAENRWSLRNHWMGATADLPGALWQLYLQTGKPEVFLAAERNARHLMAADICHEATRAQVTQADPRRRKIAGAFGDHRTPMHWMSTSCVSGRHARIRGLLLDYYLTGDLNARDTALLWADAARQYGPAVAGEDGLAYMANLSEVLLFSYDPALLERLGDCADYFLRIPLNPGETEQWAPGLRFCARASGDRRLSAYLKSMASVAPTVKRDAFHLVGLLRDLAAAGDAASQAQADSLIAEVEKSAEEPLNGTTADYAGLSWEDFCAYVFGAGVPAETFKVEPAPKAAK